MQIEENKDFLTTQIITYLGNKRSLIGNIEKEIIEIENKLGSKKLVCADLFSGSGIVARMLQINQQNFVGLKAPTYLYKVTGQTESPLI